MLRRFRVCSYKYYSLEVIANSWDDATEKYYELLCNISDIEPDKRDVMTHIENIICYGQPEINEEIEL